MTKIVRRIATLTVLLGLLASIPLVSQAGVAAVSAHQPYCGIRWGSLPKDHLVSAYTTATIANLRAGRHACFDRLVVDLGPRRTGLPGAQGDGHQVRYVSRAGLAMQGGAVLAVVVNAAAHDDDYQPTYDPQDPDRAVDVTGFRTFRQIAFLETFESHTEVVIGVRERLPFRVFILAGPEAGSRLVIDVAHRW